MSGTLTRRAHQVVRQALSPGEVAIDATLGNGHDAVVLCEAVGPTGSVWAFDIQASAVESANRMLERQGWQNAHLLNKCHSRMIEFMPSADRGRVGAVMFNLGYLPRGDHAITTQAATTRTALEQAFDFLRPGGVITIVVYTAHDGGLLESRAVRDWLNSLGNTATIETIASEPPNDGRDPKEIPWLVVATKVFSTSQIKNHQSSIN
jgi:16S rRNA C1402 N4-methylase RsmH